MRDRWRYLSGRHPVTCTCVECVKARIRRARPSLTDRLRSGIRSTNFGPKPDKPTNFGPKPDEPTRKSPPIGRAAPDPAGKPRSTTGSSRLRPTISDRLRWSVRRWRRTLSDWNRGFWDTLRWLALRTFMLVLLVTVAITAYHWYNGAPFESAVRMTGDDYRLIYGCPTEYEVLIDFARRPSPPDYYYRMADRYGDDWAEQVCGADLMYGESGSPTQATEDRDASGAAASREPETPILLASQLPRDVFEQFQDDFYFTCPKPRKTDLTVLKSWSSTGAETIRFTPPRQTYFLVVVATSTESGWQFDSVVNSGATRHQSLHLDSSAPDHLTDAQAWCTRGVGTSPTSVLDIASQDLDWTILLVGTDGDIPVPEAVKRTLDGFYDLCPALPPFEELTSTVLGSSTTTSASLPYSAQPPHYFIGVDFEPNARNWYFRSVDIGGSWRAPGPIVSSQSSERIDSTATCPQSSSSHHLEIEAEGGRWTVYLITVKQ